jgi:hypothetical protein
MSPRKNNKPSIPPPQSLEPDEVMNRLDFDSLEDRIRGDEAMQSEDSRRLIESRNVKKKLDESEVDRRLAELKKKLRK